MENFSSIDYASAMNVLNGSSADNVYRRQFIPHQIQSQVPVDSPINISQSAQHRTNTAQATVDGLYPNSQRPVHYLLIPSQTDPQGWRIVAELDSDQNLSALTQGHNVSAALAPFGNLSASVLSDTMSANAGGYSLTDHSSSPILTAPKVWNIMTAEAPMQNISPTSQGFAPPVQWFNLEAHAPWHSLAAPAPWNTISTSPSNWEAMPQGQNRTQYFQRISAHVSNQNISPTGQWRSTAWDGNSDVQRFQIGWGNGNENEDPVMEQERINS